MTASASRMEALIQRMEALLTRLEALVGGATPGGVPLPLPSGASVQTKEEKEAETQVIQEFIRRWQQGERGPVVPID